MKINDTLLTVYVCTMRTVCAKSALENHNQLQGFVRQGLYIHIYNKRTYTTRQCLHYIALRLANNQCRGIYSTTRRLLPRVVKATLLYIPSCCCTNYICTQSGPLHNELYVLKYLSRAIRCNECISWKCQSIFPFIFSLSIYKDFQYYRCNFSHLKYKSV